MSNKENKSFDILCVGACVQDILIEGISRENFGEPVTVLKKVIFTSGGDAANEAVVLGRLGSRVGLIAKIDKGPVGDALYRNLKNEGVDISQLYRDNDSRSTTAFVVLEEDGEHRFFLDKGRNEGIALHEIDLDVLRRTKAVCIGSLYTCYKLDQGGNAELLKEAKKAGAVTFADVDHDVEHLGPDAMDCVYPYVDYLLPSMAEACYITGTQDERKAADLLRMHGAGTVVVKMGAQGCYVKSEEEEFYVDPFSVEPKDTTGCGDNFTAGFIHSVLGGKSLYESARFACAAGAVNALETGAHMAVRSKKQIEEFMSSTAQRKVIRAWGR